MQFVIYEVLWSENLRIYQQYSSTDSHVTSCPKGKICSHPENPAYEGTRV